MIGTATLRRALARLSLLAVASVVALPIHASAVTPKPAIEFDAGVLTITGTAGAEDLEVGCSMGEVTIGFVTQDGFKCRRVKMLIVSGRAGSDDIDLSDVGPAKFENLVSATTRGGGGPDFLQGWSGTDHLLGGGGPDSLEGGNGSDDLNGGAGFDELYVSGKNPTALAGGVVRVGSSKDQTVKVELLSVGASSGNDVVDLSRWAGPTEIDAGGGDDTVVGSAHVDLYEDYPYGGNDIVSLGRGDDEAEFMAGSDSYKGMRGTDRVVSGCNAGDMTLTDEMLTVSGHGDVALDSFEDARLFANSGVGLVFNASAWTGSVSLRGGVGNDTLVGGSGRDVIDGYDGTDTISGGPGKDTLLFPSLEGAGGTLTVTSSQAVSSDDGTMNFVNIERMEITLLSAHTVDAAGFTGSVTVEGSDEGDAVTGAVGNDVIYGRGGDDILSGSAGIDYVNGGTGTDTCAGEDAENCEL